MTLGILLVDPQLDFYPDGTLAVTNGNAINAPINALLKAHAAAPVFVSRDWHPVDTCHFQARGGTWPPHCVRETKGATFHADLELPDGHHVYSKGQDPENDAGYSAFEGVRDDGESLSQTLEKLGVDTLFVAGFATDYCVKASCLDAVKNGLLTFLYVPGVRAVNLQPDDGDKAIAEMQKAGVMCLGCSS
ncbi:MAG: isochorismatase family protein [Deltaproteobacteria bacterium]|nr:isochorismatase family protein [Deltaproteobacteria bacterium]